MKFCKKCLLNKDLSSFYNHPLGKDGKRSMCIDCFKIDKRNHYYKNKALPTKFQTRHSEEYYLINFGCNQYNYRRRIDPMFRLQNNVRKRIGDCLKRKNWRKDNTFSKYIGCSLKELKNYIETKFQIGMTWENYNLKSWHIDHIIPLSSAKTQEELYKLCHYTNLQPLWAKDNLQKSNKIIL